MRLNHAVKRTGNILRCLAFSLVFVLLLCYEAGSVSASGEYVLCAGDTMVIPCLMELWSDQSVECVIGNTDVLMLDGSGRAVIALRSGTSDVYVHITNPDIDVRYTFIVTEPARNCEPETEWTEPVRENTPAPPRAEPSPAGAAHSGPSSDAPAHAETSPTGEAHSGPSSDASSETEPSAAGPANTEPYRPESEPQGSAFSDSADTDSEVQMESGNGGGIIMPPESTAAAEDRKPFWENPAEGGIMFELLHDSPDINGPLMKISGDGEVKIIFVCAGGREISWKYQNCMLYAENLSADQRPVRVGAMDCHGNMYYYSS